MNALALAAETVPERHYTHHTQRGETPHRSNPKVIHRELATLEAGEGMRVIEVGTGSGYSGALLADLVGESGQVTSIDIDPYLTRWANLIHHQRGLNNLRCFATDGTAGFPERGPYDRLVAWCTPPQLPASWLEQLTEGAVIVAPLPIADLPQVTVVVKIRVRGGQPRVEAVFHGGYIETGTAPGTDFTVPLRWVDWEYRHPTPAWISTAWRERDDWQHSGARTALDLLREDAHRETYVGGSIDWASWRTWAAATGDPQLTMACLAPDLLALGHATPTTAAVLQQDGTLLTDAPNSPSLTALRGWLADWEKAGRPAPETYTPALIRHAEDDRDGWNLRLTR